MPLPPLGIFAKPAGVSTSFESIATVTVGAGGSSSITFSSIPSTYKHLQIRGIAKSDRTLTNGKNDMLLTFNNSSATAYAAHGVEGTGSAAAIEAYTSQTKIIISKDFIVGNGTGYGSMFGAMVIDILDYTSTDKAKTIRALSGADQNGAGTVALNSGLWYATPAAINRIDLSVDGAYNFLQYSSFALYGIKA